MSQIATATRGRDLLLNVPFPRKQPDLLMAESPPTGGLSALNGAQQPPCCAARRCGGSGQDVVQRRRESVARFLEFALDVQPRRAGLGPEIEEVGPARQLRVVGLGDRLDPVDLAWSQHQRLGAVLLHTTAQVLDCEPIAGEVA